MAWHKPIAVLPTCPRCGARASTEGARFCGHCGALLTGEQGDLPQWQRPAPAKYRRGSLSRMALSCPECGEPMRFGFRRVCRRCGAELVMVPRAFHPYHQRVYVKGPRALAALLGFWLFWGTLVLGALALIGRAHK